MEGEILKFIIELDLYCLYLTEEEYYELREFGFIVDA